VAEVVFIADETGGKLSRIDEGNAFAYERHSAGVAPFVSDVSAFRSRRDQHIEVEASTIARIPRLGAA